MASGYGKLDNINYRSEHILKCFKISLTFRMKTVEFDREDKMSLEILTFRKKTLISKWHVGHGKMKV